MHASRPALRALAERVGILPSYVAQHDGQPRHTSDETREALLAALGHAAADEDTAARTLAELEAADRARTIAPANVDHEGAPARVEARGLGDGECEVSYEAVLTTEDGDVLEHRGRAAVEAGTATLRLPRASIGVHDLLLRIRVGGRTREAEQIRCVVPRRCVLPAELVGERRVFGIWANLYSLRSEDGAGVGNVSDLRDLVRFTAEAGGDFVGVNPLHALRNRGQAVSPYGPTSRLFRNPIYLDPWAVPELEHSLEARLLLESSAVANELAWLRRAPRVEYERAQALLRPLLRALHRTSIETGRQLDHARARDFTAYKERGGSLLRDFATFCALEDRLAEDGVDRDWRRWPAELRDPDSPAVEEFRDRNAQDVDFHAFLQFELDRQLEATAVEAERLGLGIGIYQDLAVGTLASGFDPWAFRGLFVDGASLGAPPDDYSATGQDWGLPPVDPRRLAEGGYRYWRALLASAFAHSGALRLDHVMGLLRQYWVPAGRPGTEGAYVAFPWPDLAGLVALASHRQRALVIGEDLGTVPDGFRSLLSRAGMLSSRVLVFCRQRGGAFRPASDYPERALVTANTHDHPPLAAWWEASDVDLRERLDVLDEDEARRARASREADRRALLRRLARSRTLGGSPDAAPSRGDLGRAVHAFLASTPCKLMGVSLDDLAGETEPINVPGLSGDRHPSWTRRMSKTLAQLRDDPDATAMLEGTQGRRRRRGRRA